MRISTEVRVDGTPIRFQSWRTGFAPGSMVQTFEVTPLEAAVTYVPADILTPHPCEIIVTANGVATHVLKNGHIDETADGIQIIDQRTGAVDHTNTISGRDEAWKILEQGPRRDTIFVPRGIVESVYPRGVRIRTLAGESIVGLPPGVNPRLYGPFASGGGDSGTFGGGGGLIARGGIPGEGALGGRTSGQSTLGGGTPLSGQYYQMITEIEYVDDDGADACSDENRFGTTEDWVNTVPPVIVLIGQGGSGHIFSGSGTGGGSGSTLFGGPNYSSGGGASVNGLIKLIAKKAGFTEVLINTPDIGVFEPFTVSAGSRWIDAIQTLVGPWNAMIFVWENKLNIIDVEAANIGTPSLTIGPASASVISRRVSVIPPYRTVDIIGTLRRTIRRPRAGNSEVFRNGIRDTPHQGPFEQAPYNVSISDSFGPTESGTAVFNGSDAVVWTSISCFKKYYVNPDAGQVTLLFSSDSVYDNEGIYHQHVMQLNQHTMDEQPHGMIEEDYGRVVTPGGFIQFMLIRRVTTIFDDQTELEGVHATHSLVDGLIVYTLTPDGGAYKAMPYSDAAASGTTDLSATSLDAMTFGRLSERHEDYHIIDQNVGRKRTWEVDSLGNRPPRFTDEAFARRHSYDPRQRWCMPVNDQNGQGVKSIAALFFANKRQAQMIQERARRRAGQRHQEYTVELSTYLPGLRPGMTIKLDGTPIRVGSDTQVMSTESLLSGTFFLSGYDHSQSINNRGQSRVETRLYLRSAF